LHLNIVLSGAEQRFGGRERGRKEGVVVFGGWTQVKETARARERIEKYQEASSHTQPVSVALTALGKPEPEWRWGEG
jgi:hypothetical protein